MKEFDVREGTYIKSNNSTSKMMNNFIISLIPIIIFSFIKNGLYPYMKTGMNFIDLIRPLLMLLLSIFSCIMTEYFWQNIIKKKKNNFKYYYTQSYIIIPGILLALMLPLKTPLYLLIIGGIIATIGRNILGGFGSNLLNPALLSRTFIIILIFLFFDISYSNNLESNLLTPLTLLKNNNFIISLDTINNTYGSLFNMFLGFVPGLLGMTSSLLCLISFIYLAINKVIKCRITIYYILTVFIITAIFGFSNNMGIWYPLLHILSGGLIFSAVFIATDPVTSPITTFGQTIYGIILGILTVLLRFIIPVPEEVIIIILMMNLIVPLINKISIKTQNNSVKRLIYYISLIIIIIIVPIIINGLK